jgi:hypothetical protein
LKEEQDLQNSTTSINFSTTVIIRSTVPFKVLVFHNMSVTTPSTGDLSSYSCVTGISGSSPDTDSDSGSNPERAHGDKFLVCQLSKFATQQEM